MIQQFAELEVIERSGLLGRGGCCCDTSAWSRFGSPRSSANLSLSERYTCRVKLENPMFLTRRGSENGGIWDGAKGQKEVDGMLEERGSGGTGEGLTTRRRILGLASSLSTATRDNLTSGRQGPGVRDSCCLTRTRVCNGLEGRS